MKRRSGTAIVALGRKAGPMKHRLEPKGGSQPVIQPEPAIDQGCGCPDAEVRNCPYAYDIENDPDQRCNCCDDCAQGCAHDI